MGSFALGVIIREQKIHLCQCDSEALQKRKEIKKLDGFLTPTLSED